MATSIPFCMYLAVMIRCVTRMFLPLLLNIGSLTQGLLLSLGPMSIWLRRSQIRVVRVIPSFVYSSLNVRAPIHVTLTRAETVFVVGRRSIRIYFDTYT